MAGVAPAACHTGAPGCRPVSFDLVLKHGPESGTCSEQEYCTVCGQRGGPRDVEMWSQVRPGFPFSGLTNTNCPR